MGQDNCDSESKFGFKDKAKALETLEILKNHELQYRKLTVRGLLGRAKRVLSMTKAEEKIQNINEAINVFEEWLEENASQEVKNKSKEEPEEKVETVPGLGFKDRSAAENTLKVLEGRDPEYQKLAVKGLIGSSKRVLSGTKNKDKIQSIKEGVEVLEDFLEKFERDNLIQTNKPYLPYSIIEQFEKPQDLLVIEFLDEYGINANGNYKHLRTRYPKNDDSISWDIIRNKQLKSLLENVKLNNIKLFNENGEPTKDHIMMIHWAYSPQSEKIKTYVKSLDKKSIKRKETTVEKDSFKKSKLN